VFDIEGGEGEALDDIAIYEKEIQIASES
jgi:hypothetical protein